MKMELMETELTELPPRPTEKDRLIPVFEYKPNFNDRLRNDPNIERSCCFIIIPIFCSFAIGVAIFLSIMFFS